MHVLYPISLCLNTLENKEIQPDTNEFNATKGKKIVGQKKFFVCFEKIHVRKTSLLSTE